MSREVIALPKSGLSWKNHEIHSCLEADCEKRIGQDLDAKNRNQIRLAADKIDSLLKWNPSTIGESRRESVRILVVPPLAVEYRVQDDDRIVNVVAVWTFKRRK